MKCEICHKSEAKTAITVKQGEIEKELYVCENCAAAARKTTTVPTRGEAKPKVSVIEGSTTPPPPFVEELVKATLGFMKGVAEAEEHDKKVCPTCHAKWEQIKESGRLGCPSCWKTFAREIRAEYLSAEFGQGHVGSAPAIERLPDSSAAKAVLERDLKAAIACEDYHRAALLKRRLDEILDGGKESRS